MIVWGRGFTGILNEFNLEIEMSGQLINIAAENGHIECLRLLLDAKAPIDPKATYWAASNGHLEFLRLLLDAKAPIDSGATYWAAYNGHVGCLRLLLDAKAPIDRWATSWAKRNSETECAKLILNYVKTQNTKHKTQNQLNQKIGD